jgi:hypothetical protein
MLKRLMAAIGAPILLVALAILVSAFTRWLDGYIAGRVAMLVFIACMLAWVARMAWTWPGLRDDDEA